MHQTIPRQRAGLGKVDIPARANTGQLERFHQTSWIEQNIPPILSEFAVQRASGAELALRFHKLIAIEGEMPGGGRNRVAIAVASIPALLAMKGHALMRRKKRKDAYDVYYCIRNYEGGIDALAAACRPLLEIDEAREGFLGIADKFAAQDMIGPV